MSTDRTPFIDLPAALVEELLGQAAAVGDHLLKTFRGIRDERNTLRRALEDRGLIMHESKLGCPLIPTTCGTDGSYSIERMLTADLAAAAAVAVEGLIPPSESRHWEQPHHSTFVVTEAHHAETATVLRAVMLGRELLLATGAPHDVVMLDTTLTLPIIYFNQALNMAPRTPLLRCSAEFLEHAGEYLEAYVVVLESARSDKYFVGLPKYSTRREIGKMAGWPGEHDDRGLLTMLLRPGELTEPLPLEPPPGAWHVNVEAITDRLGQEQARSLAQRIAERLKQIHLFYYKPHPWLPALRVEMARNAATNPHRLGTVVQALKYQCATGAMFEPYPLYLADRMVKALARAVPAFRQVATQRVSESYEGEVSDVFFAMHGYRSESGA